MTAFRDIYFQAKSEQRLSQEQAGSVKSRLFGPKEGMPYHAILAFGLIESPNSRNLSRLVGLGECFLAAQEDDLLKACLTSGCIYWNAAQDFCNLSQKVLNEEDQGLFQESALVAATCVSKVARSERSEELLKYLVSCAKISLQKGDTIRAEALANEALKAATGEKWITSAQIRSFLDETNLDTIRFGMKFSSS